MVTMTDTRSPALHVARSHDLIRVHGARENNLKDVSVEIPKRRLTVFAAADQRNVQRLRAGLHADASAP
jgi:hypothetical protein